MAFRSPGVVPVLYSVLPISASVSEPLGGDTYPKNEASFSR